MRPTSRVSAVAASILLVLGVAGCSSGEGGDEDPSGATGGSVSGGAATTGPGAGEDPADGGAAAGDGSITEDPATGDSATAGSGEAADEGRLEAVQEATSADLVTWEGSNLVLTFETGSAEHPVADLHCRTMSNVMGEGERLVIRYPDGEITCEPPESTE